MNNVLIIGGTARSCKTIISYLEKENFNIDLITYRQKDKIYGKYNWINLDFEDFNSVDNFVKNLPINYYSKIIFLSGNSISDNVKDINLQELKHFYNSYLFNYNLLLTNSIKSLNENGQIIFISSIAANEAILDIHYSAAKAANQALVKSLSLYAKENQAMVSIAPGTITDEIREQIAKLIININKIDNGKIFKLGY
jgi:NAD(P)-dependent dehydrogenase (short-subunit alcohol dehydrogenase family)